MAKKELTNVEQKSIEQFDEWSESYDHGIWQRYFSASLDRALSIIDTAQPTILDIGCATGDLCFKFLQQHPDGKAVGLDISPAMIQKAKAKAQRLGLSEKQIEFIVGSADDLDMPVDSFDYIFCLNSFHHYPRPIETIKSIRPILKPGGCFVLMDPFTDNPIRRLWSFILKRIFDEGYVTYHSRSFLASIISEAGLSLVSQTAFWYFVLVTVARKDR